MKYKEAEQLFGEIDNQGFGYWIQNYGYEGKDKELERLCKVAREAMDELEDYINNIWDEHEIG